MKDKSRYDASELIEGQFEPGSGRRVLRNILGIKSKREIGRVETRELLRAQDELVIFAGLERNYEPMERIFTDVIGRTLEQ